MFPVVPLAFQRIIKIKRRQTGAYVNHRYTEPVAIESDLKGSVQPLTPKDLKALPEGEEVTAGIKVFTADPNGTKNTDILVDGTEEYKVISVLPWNYHGYYKITAGLLDA